MRRPHLKDAGMVQHMKNNKYNPQYKQIPKKLTTGSFHKIQKRPLTKYNTLHDKKTISPREIRDTRDITQHNKDKS